MTHKVDFDALRTIVSQDNVLELAKHTAQVAQAANEVDINGRGLLHAAVHARAGDSLQWLLDQGVSDVNLADNQGETPLMRAAWLGDKSAVDMLLEAGGDLHKTSPSGGTALHFAYAGGTPAKAIIDVLIKAGADAQAVDASGAHPEAWASQAAAREEGERLLAQGKARGKLSLGRKNV